ncbi:MAG: glycosyltransferase family 4 protein [Betaproteobacteria bacterium]
MKGRRIRSLLFSTLYPSAARPLHGIFVETRLRELLKTGEVDAKVVAPVPWFPASDPRFGAWSRFAATPRQEARHGVEVWHPRYALPPRIGMSLAPFALALGARRVVSRLIRDGFDFDLIDAHYYYPDGVAAALLAQWFNKPFVVTARGTDLNLLPHFAIPRRLIQWTAQRAAASVGVSGALTEVLAGLNAPRERLVTLRNGVDLQRFRPLSKADCRATLGLPKEARIILTVGHLVELKGNHIVVDAVARLRAQRQDVYLAIVGDGEERSRLESRVTGLGLGASVRFVGAVANADLAPWYSAADALVLASSREGWPNVLLESMACGTPVIASRIASTPEIVRDPVAGELFDRDPEALAAAIDLVLGRPAHPSAVRAYAEQFGWEATSLAQVNLFASVVGNSARQLREAAS